MISFRRLGSAATAVVPTHAAAGEISSDELLIWRIANGDRLAMQVLFARHRTPVYRWLLRFVSQETLAEDLLSEVFLEVWRQAGGFEARSSVSTWLISIARFKALSSRRRRAAAPLEGNHRVHGCGPGWRSGSRAAEEEPGRAAARDIDQAVARPPRRYRSRLLSRKIGR